MGNLKNRESGAYKDIRILWVRGHIGIAGNEKADKRAEFESVLGDISGKDRITTEEGVRATSRAIRQAYRQQPGYNRMEQALSQRLHLD